MHFKAVFYLNKSEFESRLKRELLRLKWVGNTTRKLTPSKQRPRLVGDCLMSVTQKFTQNRKTLVNVVNGGILALLEM